MQKLRASADSPFSRFIDPKSQNIRRCGRSATMDFLIKCIFDARDAGELIAVEDVIGPFLFGGRPYYHSYLESTDEVGEFGFFDEL